jgi:integrase/recombinase XerC
MAGSASMIESFLKYLRSEKRLSSNTVLAYQSDLEQYQHFITATFPDDKPETADFGVIRSWIIQLVETGIEPVSVNRKIACLRSYYKYLLRQEIISKDPMLKIKVMKSKKKLPGFVKETEMHSILDQPYDSTLAGLRTKLILELFYGTGIRLSELINLRESNIDLRNRTIKVLGKRNKERVIPFNASLADSIDQYKKVRNKEMVVKDHGLLLVSDRGDACYPMMIYRIVKEHLRTTSTEKRSPHVLRHTYATHLLDKGAEINAVKDLLGHSSLAATQVYTHNSMEKLKKAFDQAHPKA